MGGKAKGTEERESNAQLAREAKTGETAKNRATLFHAPAICSATLT